MSTDAAFASAPGRRSLRAYLRRQRSAGGSVGAGSGGLDLDPDADALPRTLSPREEEDARHRSWHCRSFAGRGGGASDASDWDPREEREPTTTAAATFAASAALPPTVADPDDGHPLDGAATESADRIDDDNCAVRRFKTKKGIVWSNGVSWGAVGEESVQKKRFSGTKTIKGRARGAAAVGRSASMPVLSSAPGKQRAKSASVGSGGGARPGKVTSGRRSVSLPSLPSLPGRQAEGGPARRQSARSRTRAPWSSRSAKEVNEESNGEGGGGGGGGSGDTGLLC